MAWTATIQERFLQGNIDPTQLIQAFQAGKVRINPIDTERFYIEVQIFCTLTGAEMWKAIPVDKDPVIFTKTQFENAKATIQQKAQNEIADLGAIITYLENNLT